MDEQKLLKSDKKKDLVIPELTTVGILGIIVQTFVSFVAWVTFESFWKWLKSWWEKKKKNS